MGRGDGSEVRAIFSTVAVARKTRVNCSSLPTSSGDPERIAHSKPECTSHIGLCSILELYLFDVFRLVLQRLFRFLQQEN